jgi:hypothetical protein
LARASAQPLVLLVVDDLEVWSVDSALALASAETSEVVANRRYAVACSAYDAVLGRIADDARTADTEA